MTTALSLTPLFRQTVGFDRFNDIFQSLLEGDEPTNNYPPYNIEKCGEDDYAITMAVAGFTDHDINITVHRDQIIITGRAEQKDENGMEYLYRGIAQRAFERNFRLADYMKVTGAELKNGLLRVQLKREIPEEAKPRLIPINTGLDNGGQGTPTLEAKNGKQKTN